MIAARVQFMIEPSRRAIVIAIPEMAFPIAERQYVALTKEVERQHRAAHSLKQVGKP